MVELLRVIADSTGCSRLNGRVSHDPTKGRKGIPSYTTAKVENVVTTVVDLYIQHRNIRYIQRDCDLRFDRFALLSIIDLNIISPRQIPHHYNILGSPRKLSKNHYYRHTYELKNVRTDSSG